jgi:F-type H+-transporting ATPase subunit epsilon
MARSRFVAEVLTPEGEVFNEEVEMVSTRTSSGSIGLLAHHAPVLARLEPTELRLYRSGTEIVRFAQAEGYVQMSENRALLLVEEAIDPAKLNRGELERTRDEASAQPGSEDAARAGRDLRRAEAFLHILADA